MRCTMGFLLAGIRTHIPLAVQSQSLDDADDSDLVISAMPSLRARNKSVPLLTKEDRLATLGRAREIPRSIIAANPKLV